jgi:four helix bundle protein
MSRYFPHETLEVYKLAVQVARKILAAKFPRGLSPLRDQAVRASTSMPLNIAEGNARRGDAKKNHFEIARGSAAETCAILDVVQIDDYEQIQYDLRRIAAMLYNLSK